MSLLNRKTALILGLLASIAAVGATAAPAYACTCNTINFSPTTSSGSPHVVTTNPTIFTGNTVSLETGSFGGGNDWVYVSITGITPGWTVVVTSPDTVTTLSGTQIIVGPFDSSSSSFPYTITVTAPLTPGASGHFTINAEPSDSATSYSAVGVACAPVTVYLVTSSPTFPPPSTGVPQFPAGMALLMALAIPALLLVKSKSKVIAA